MVLLSEDNPPDFKVQFPVSTPYLDNWSTYVIPEADPDIGLAYDKSDYWKRQLESMEWIQDQYLDELYREVPQNVLDFIDECYYNWRKWEGRYLTYRKRPFDYHIRKYGVTSLMSGLPRMVNLAT